MANEFNTGTYDVEQILLEAKKRRSASGGEVSAGSAGAVTVSAPSVASKAAVKPEAPAVPAVSGTRLPQKSPPAAVTPPAPVVSHSANSAPSAPTKSVPTPMKSASPTPTKSTPPAPTKSSPPAPAAVSSGLATPVKSAPQSASPPQAPPVQKAPVTAAAPRSRPSLPQIDLNLEGLEKMTVPSLTASLAKEPRPAVNQNNLAQGSEASAQNNKNPSSGAVASRPAAPEYKFNFISKGENNSAKSPLKTIAQLLDDDNPLSDGFKPFGSHSRGAPHAITPQELLGSKPSSEPSSEPAKKTPAPAGEYDISRILNEVTENKAPEIPPVNPFLQNRSMYDKTLHTKPAAEPAAGRIFKSSDVETDPVPENNTTPENIPLTPAVDDINAKKREYFNDSEVPGYNLTEDFRLSGHAPEIASYIDEPVNSEPFDIAKAKDKSEFNSPPAAKRKIRLFDGEEEDNEPEEVLIFPDDDTDIINDFENMEDAPAIRTDLASRSRRAALRLFANVIGFSLLALGALMPLLGISLPLLSPAAGSESTYLILQLLIISTLCVFNISTLRGFASLFAFKPDFDSAVALSAVFSIIHSIILLFNPEAVTENNIHSFAAVAAFAFLLSSAGKAYMLSRVRGNFEEIACFTPKKSAFILNDEKLAADAAAHMTLGEPVICCTRETGHLKNFLYHSFSEDPADGLCAKLAPIGLIAAVLAFAAALLLKQGIVGAFTALCSVICLFVPCASLILGHSQLALAARRLREEGATLSGFDSVAEFCYTSSVCLTAKELFPAGNITLYSIRTCGEAVIDQVILDCASVAIASDSALSELFDKVIEGQRSILPKIEALEYEDKLGISGSVSGRRVLVGNHELCRRHQVRNLPDPEVERKILRTGKFPVYLASDGELAAIIIVGYEADSDVTEALSRLSNKGVSLLVTTSDPNITNEMLCEKFDLYPEYVEVLPAGITVGLYRKTLPSRTDEALISHKNSTSAFINAISASISLKNKFSLLLILQVVSICAGAAMGLYSLITSSGAWASVPLILLFQAASLVLSRIILSLRS